MLFPVALILLVGSAFAGFCPPMQVPVGVNVTAAGPDIICERPACNIQHDRRYECSYFESSCPGAQSWVSGIHLPNKDLKLACCETPYLKNSQLIGQTNLMKGDSFTGGFFSKNGEQGFDAIFDLEIVNGGYKITVARVTCPGRVSDLIQAAPSRDSNNVAGNQLAGLGLGFGNAGNAAFGGPQQQLVQDEELLMDNGPSSFGGLPQGGAPAGFFSGGGIPAIGAAACFSEDTTVTTQTGSKTMKDLKVGDMVLTVEEGRFFYAPVTSWLHRYENKQANFLDIQAGDTKLTITGTHFIYTTPCAGNGQSWEMKYARDIVIGKDCLLRVEGDEVSNMKHQMVEVDSMTPTVRTGYYGPMTSTGQIVVNEMIASCHAIVKDGTLLNSLLDLATNMENGLKSVKNVMGMQTNENVDEMPASLEYLMSAAQAIFPENWKTIEQ